MRVVFDIDDTISRHKNRDYPNAEPILEVITQMRKLRETNKDAVIILHTARGMNSCGGDARKAEEKNRKTLEEWLKKWDVPYDDVNADIDKLVSSFQWQRAEGFNTTSSEKKAKFEGMTMADYMRWLWNNPQSGQSPYKLFEGALVPTGKDANGNIIYKYNGAKF